jgi:hypothetical protein
MNDMTAPPRPADTIAAIAMGETLDYCPTHDMFGCVWCEPSAGFLVTAYDHGYHAMPRRIRQLSYYGRCSRFWREHPPTVTRPA